MRASPTLGAFLVGLMVAASPRAGARECPPRGVLLVVRAGPHRLYECDGGKMVATFRVALGSGGVGKRARGDAKTPLGTYRLGSPRPSASFHVFIPIGYPTAAQRRRGFTGAAVGVHGPARAFRWAGEANVLVDWTLGCIAVKSDHAIDAIARWVRTRHVTTIAIDPVTRESAAGSSRAHTRTSRSR